LLVVDLFDVVVVVVMVVVVVVVMVVVVVVVMVMVMVMVMEVVVLVVVAMVEQLVAERDAAKVAQADIARLTRERDQATQELDQSKTALTQERDAAKVARAEVARLTQELDRATKITLTGEVKVTATQQAAANAAFSTQVETGQANQALVIQLATAKDSLTQQLEAVKQEIARLHAAAQALPGGSREALMTATGIVQMFHRTCIHHCHASLSSSTCDCMAPLAANMLDNVSYSLV
jgi:hypothetical protein